MRVALPLVLAFAGCNSCAHTQYAERGTGGPEGADIRKTDVKLDLPSNPFPSNDPKVIGRTPRVDDFAASPPAPPDAGG